jgi:serine/threonine protein kinase
MGLTLSRGERVGPWVVESVLGRGGFATVWRVRHVESGEFRALKQGHLDPGVGEARLRLEGEVQRDLRHPNLVAVRDIIDLGGAPGLLMDFVSPPSLEQWLRAYRPSPEETECIFAGVVAGLAHAHAHGVVHRDLKPSNVLLDIGEAGLCARVTDFGLLKRIDGTEHRTRTGATMGTPAYMPPEQLRDAANVDARADVWALGCLLYELLEGRSPWAQTRDLIALYQAMTHSEWPALPTGVPERQRDVVAACLAPNRDERPENAAEVAEHLGIDPTVAQRGRVSNAGARAAQLWRAVQASLPDVSPAPTWVPASNEPSRSPVSARPGTSTDPLVSDWGVVRMQARERHRLATSSLHAAATALAQMLDEAMDFAGQEAAELVAELDASDGAVDKDLRRACLLVAGAGWSGALAGYVLGDTAGAAAGLVAAVTVALAAIVTRGPGERARRDVTGRIAALRADVAETRAELREEARRLSAWAEDLAAEARSLALAVEQPNLRPLLGASPDPAVLATLDTLDRRAADPPSLRRRLVAFSALTAGGGVLASLVVGLWLGHGARPPAEAEQRPAAIVHEQGPAGADVDPGTEATNDPGSPEAVVYNGEAPTPPTRGGSRRSLPAGRWVGSVGTDHFEGTLAGAKGGLAGSVDLSGSGFVQTCHFSATVAGRTFTGRLSGCDASGTRSGRLGADGQSASGTIRHNGANGAATETWSVKLATP